MLGNAREYYYRGSGVMQIMELEKCPHGDNKGNCVKVGCVFQHDKWKGDEVPTISIEEHKNKYVIVCDDSEEK